MFATIDRLQYEDWDAILRKKAQEATEPQLIRMVMELALLPSGYSEEPLEPTDPLASAARRYWRIANRKEGPTILFKSK